MLLFVYTFSQLIRFARACNHVTDFNAQNKCLTAKLLQQGYRYHKLRKTFSKLYRRQYELISKFKFWVKNTFRFARVCNHLADFNARNKCLTAKLLQQGYRYHKFRNTFSKFYRRHYGLIFKFNVGLKTLLREGLSEPEFYGDLVYKFKELKGMNDFSFQFRKII